MRNNNISLGLIFGAGIGLSLGVLTDNLNILPKFKPFEWYKV